MLPKDLGGFTVEQLRGFAALVDEAIANLQAAKVEGTFSADQLGEYETLADDKLRLSAAIDTALTAAADADGGEGDDDAAGDDADATADADAGDADADADATDDAEGDDAAATAPDAEAVVDEAVAAATMGGGAVPRMTISERTAMDPSAVAKFVKNAMHGASSLATADRHSFASMNRRTNHYVKAGSLVTTEMQLAAIRERAAGTDKTAAGCFCGPDDAITAIKECGDTTRPFSDSLPTITGGDVRFVRQIDLADALTGVTEWTCADQDSVDPEVISTWKPCFELDCEAEVSSQLYGVPACATFTTQQFIGNPDLIANLEHVMQVAYNKTAELLAYARFKALASQYSFGYALTGYGAGAQLLVVVGWWMELVRANLREANPGYTLTIPAGLKERIITDGFLTGQRSPDETWGAVTDRLAQLGVTNVIELVDEITGVPAPLAHATVAAPGGPIAVGAPHPNVQEIALYRPSDFSLLMAPELDLGVTRDPQLARQNKLQWFVESFEDVIKPGCAPAATIQAAFCASGIRAAAGEGEDCTEVG